MEEQYWNRFAETGKIADYLNYKGIAICKRVMEYYEGEKSVESDHNDRHGDCIITYR